MGAVTLESLDPFLTDEPLVPESYARLLLYFVAGWRRFRSGKGALVRYPGWRSWNGRRMDQLEGFSRIMPLFGAWAHSGRGERVRLPDDTVVDLAQAFRVGLVEGTNPSSEEYWGEIGDRDQRIVEAADIALALWLFRRTVWPALTENERLQVVRWLAMANSRTVYDNNWHLFVILVNAVLASLQHPVPHDTSGWRYGRIRAFYKGDGWFSDGAHGSFDYYNAWAFHYSLFWLQEIDPAFDPGFIVAARREFLETYRFLIGPEGFPFLGRSACYRLAAPAPLIFGHPSCPEQVSAGEARRGLDCTWKYFVRRGALKDGNVTQGYFGPDPRILENYSGPASCLWSLRSLIPAFYLPDTKDFWTSAGEPLPVERGDYRVLVPAVGWTIVGDRKSRSITIEKPGALPRHRTRLAGYGPLRRVLALLYPSPHRPDNYGAKYGKDTYSSSNPFCS
jgi:hypothetical protein